MDNTGNKESGISVFHLYFLWVAAFICFMLRRHSDLFVYAMDALMAFTFILSIVYLVRYIKARYHRGIGAAAIGISAVLYLTVASGGELYFPYHGSGGPYSMCASNVKLLGTALEMYAGDNNGHFPSSLDRLTPAYLHTLPTCPPAGMVTYRYVCAREPECYTVWCNGSYHTAMTRPNFPQYDAVQGLREH